jgi:hypothetical protein
MSNPESTSKSFSVIHADFYKELADWKEEVKTKNVPIEGVYTLWSDKPIKRLKGKDKNGILYIGKGDIFSNQTRIGQFINSINGTENDHGAGVRYREFQELYPLESLKLKVELINNSRTIEAERLIAYQKEFGELPPLNRSK